MEIFRQDIRYALRTLAKSPGFAIVAAITLALGIGASTAIFSVIENVLMEPFPYSDPPRLMTVQIHDTERNEPGGRGGYSGPEFLDYVEQNHVFDRVMGSTGEDILYRSGEGTERFSGSVLTPGAIEFLGMPALLGRAMQPADYERNAPPVFLLRYKTWVNRFSADPKLLNQTFVLNGTPRTLIGIMPPRFAFGDADIWLPEKPSRSTTLGWYGFPRYWFLLGHLKRGVSVREAEADFTVIANRLSKVYPKDYPKHFSVRLQSLTNIVVGKFKTTLFIVLAAVGLLLLIGCANVANLLLARATAREKEFAIRATFGGRPVAARAPASGGKPALGPGRRCYWHALGLGRAQGACLADATRDHSSRGGDSAEYTRPAFYSGGCGPDRSGLRLGSSDSGCPARSQRSSA